jgi:hypothetical protein
MIGGFALGMVTTVLNVYDTTSLKAKMHALKVSWGFRIQYRHPHVGRWAR